MPLSEAADRRAPPPERQRGPPRRLEELGALPRRAGLGHRPRRLQRRRRRLEPLPPRPGPQPRLSLERGRPGRLLQPLPEPLPVAGPLERPRPVSSRSDSSAWPTRRATTARTSRSITTTSTALPTPRLHADALQISAGRVSLRPAARGEPSPEPRPSREFELIDALGDAFAAGRYFDIFIEYAKADQEDILCRITAVQPRARPGRAAHPAARSGIATPGRGATSPNVRPRGSEADDRPQPSTGTWAIAGGTSTIGRTRRRCCSPRTRRTIERLFGVPNAGPYVKDAFHEAIVGGRPTSQSRPAGARRRRRHYHAMRRAGRHR